MFLFLVLFLLFLSSSFPCSSSGCHITSHIASLRILFSTCYLPSSLFGALASFLHQSPKATFCNPSLHPSSTFITVHQPPTLFPFTFLVSVQPYPFSLICSGIPQFTLTSISRLPQLLPSLILPLFANITRDDTALPLGLTTVTQSRSYNHISPFPAHSPTSTSIMVSTFFVESGDSVSS